MDAASVFSGIKASIALVQKLSAIAKSMKQAELKALIAELANELADTKMHMAGLKTEIAELQEENSALKSRVDGGKPKVKWGCYVFDGDENLYCPACFDTKGKRYLTNRVHAGARRCTVCQRQMSS